MSLVTDSNQLSADQRASLERYLPAALVECLFGPTPPTLTELSACMRHLTDLLEVTTSHLPSSLVKWMADDPTPGRPNGRFVRGTLLFADISGFTAMSEKLSQIGRGGAEEVTAVVNRYFDVMLEVLKQYDGDLIRFGGDALLGLFTETADLQASYDQFGIDQPSMVHLPNSATRAVMAALQMQAKMDLFAQTETSQGTFPLQMSVGVHDGQFFAAQLGHENSMEYALFGADVNHTAAIESAASAGQVLLDQATFDRVDPLLGLTPVAHPAHSNYLCVEGSHFSPLPELAPAFKTHYPLVADIDALCQLCQLLDAYTIYLPAGLLPRLIGNLNGPPVIGEHRLVASLFANINGLSELVDTLGPGHETEIIAVLNDYFLAMQQAAAYYGGVINKIDLYDHGEKLLITFGAPIAHEDDAERAVRAAMAMQEALIPLIKTIPQRVGLPDLALSQRIGISFGYVFAGFVGAAWRHEYTVMGDRVNLAARLMAQAHEGAVIVGPSVKEKVHAFTDVTLHGDVKLKGKSLPVPIYEATAVRSAARQNRGIQGMWSPLVGRLEELALLEHQLESLLLGRGSITAVIGDAGVGKSRLVREALDTLPHPLRHLHTRCLSYAESVSYGSLQELLRQLAGITPDMSELAASQQLAVELTARHLLADLPYVAHLLNLPLTESQQEKIAYLGAEALRQRTFVSVRNWLTAVSASAPLLIILDDIHWMDGASLDLLDYLLTQTTHFPIGWLLLFRPDRQKGCWQLHTTLEQQTDFPYTIQPVSGLDAENARALLKNLLVLESWPAEVDELILARAEGNPLYLEEVIRALINDEVLKQGPNGRWQFVQPLHTISVPDTLEGVLMARLDRLETVCRWTIQVASVIGRQFPLDVLDHAMTERANQPLERPLAELQVAEMVRVAQQQPELLYSFIHSLLQEVAYGSLSIKARQTYHQLIATYLESCRTQGWGDVENLSPIIAHHAFVAGDWPLALLYQMRAGEQAMSLFANQDAINHYLKALESAEKLSLAETAVERLRIHLALGELYITTNQFSDAEAHLEKAERLAMVATEPAALTAVCRWRTRLHELRGEYDTAFYWIERGLGVGVETADIAQIKLLAGLIHIRQGNYPAALENCRSALDLAQRHNQVTAIARAYNLLGITELRSDSQQAITYFQQAYALYYQAGDIQGQATSHNLIANACFNLGRWKEANHHYRQALEIFYQVGDTYNRIMAVNNLGGIALNQGNLDEALTFYTEGVELAQRIQASPWMLGVFEMNLGATFGRRNEPEAALHHLHLSEAYFTQADSKEFLPEMLRHRADAFRRQGQFSKAKAQAAAAYQAATEQENQSEQACCRRVQGEIFLDLGMAGQAVPLLEESVSILALAGEVYELARSRTMLARALWQSLRDKKPVQALLHEAQKEFQHLQATLDLTAVSSLQHQIDIHH